MSGEKAIPDESPRGAFRLGLRQLEAAEHLFAGGYCAAATRALLGATSGLAEQARALSVDPEAALAACEGLAEFSDDDDQLGVRHRGRIASALARARELAEALDRATLDERERARRARRRWASRLGVATIAIALLVSYAVRSQRVTLRAVSTEHWGNDVRFVPERAVDGRPDTEWLTNDGREEVLELRLSRPAHLRAVRLLNARNPPHFDRATHEFDLELYAEGRLLRRVHSYFDEFSQNPHWLEIGVEAHGVDRIRFVPRSHYGLGAGLAEFEVVAVRSR